MADAKARGASGSSSLASSPIKILGTPSLDNKKKPKMRQEAQMDTTPPPTSAQQDKEKTKRNDEETSKGNTQKKKRAKTQKSNNNNSNKTVDEERKESENEDDVEEEEEKSSTEESEEDEAAAEDRHHNAADDGGEAVEDERSGVGSGGLFFLRRRRSRAKARPKQEKPREALMSEKRQQLIKLKRLVEADTAPLHVEFELPGGERNVDFVTKKVAACFTKPKEEHGDDDAVKSQDSSDDDEATATASSSSSSKERNRKNSLGSFGYGLWVPPSGRSRRAMTDSELVITERPDVDVPMRRKGSLTKGPLVTTFVLPRKGGDNASGSGKSKDNTAREAKREQDKTDSAKATEKDKEEKEKKEKEKERKKKLRNLSRSAPAGPASNVLSEEDEECDDDDEDEECDDDEEEFEEEDEDDEDDDDEEEDDDDERACRYNQDGSVGHRSPAFRDRTMSKETGDDEEFVPRAAFLDVVLAEAKDLLVLNKRAMRKLFKYKLFSPFFTVSVGENTTRTKRTTIASPTFNDHLTFVYQEGPGETKPTLSVKLFYRCRTKAHRARRLHVGTAEVPLARLAADKTHDMWLPIIPTCDYQLLWNWQKLGNDASNDARDARISGKSKDRSRIRLGSVHMTIHKTLDQSTGALSQLGLPSLAVPLRLQVGDVILFHCSQFASHGAKLATRSRWDHVAMVAKHRKREGLYLFEATRDGVHLFHLDRRLAFYLESRTELGVRRLRTERTQEMEEALHDFVAEVDGRPYKTNPLELLRALRDSNESDNLDTIFCSQLVAAAYQRMGILSQELCSNNYLPADFATTKISDNLIGAELDDVVLVPPVRQKGSLGNDQPFGSGVGGSAPGSFQIGSFPF